MINASLPRHVYGYVRAEFLYDLQSHHGEMVKAAIFAVASVSSRALGFHVLLENGAQFARLPIHAIAHRPDAPRMALNDLELWDCFGYDVSVTALDYLREMEVQCVLPSGTYGGVYVATLDWKENGFSDEPSQHKVVHLIALDNGCFALQPNNRCRFIDRSFVTPFVDKPGYLVNTHRWHAEEDQELDGAESYFYGVNREGDREESGPKKAGAAAPGVGPEAGGGD